MLIYPNYYKKFTCIANRCKHSCCVGWEIDIDEDSLEYYNALGGDFGKRVRNSIEMGEDGTPHFKLCKGERCPFLNESGLCEMYIALGEDSLCEICTEHPRFYNHFEDICEVGLGLCCESACELILRNNEPFELENFTPNDENYTANQQNILLLREKLFAIMKNREASIKERHKNLLSALKIDAPSSDFGFWQKFYSDLERLDSSWDDILHDLGKISTEQIYDFAESESIASEQLTNYFIYRYFTTNEHSPTTWLSFAILSTQIILALSLVNKIDLCEIARMYSGEIEYDTENIERILENLYD